MEECFKAEILKGIFAFFLCPKRLMTGRLQLIFIFDYDKVKLMKNVTKAAS